MQSVFLDIEYFFLIVVFSVCLLFPGSDPRVFSIFAILSFLVKVFPPRGPVHSVFFLPLPSPPLVAIRLKDSWTHTLHRDF